MTIRVICEFVAFGCAAASGALAIWSLMLSHKASKYAAEAVKISQRIKP